MADSFNLTNVPIRVTATTAQSLDLVLDVSDYDDLDALLSVVGFEGAGSATIEIQTSMQKDTADGWVQLLAFSSVTGTNVYEKKAGTGLLRYIRWRVSALSSTAVVFEIRGMLRVRGG